MNNLLTTKEAAAELGFSEQRVRVLIAEGRLPAERFGARSYAIKRSNLNAVRGLKPGRPKKREAASKRALPRKNSESGDFLSKWEKIIKGMEL